MFSFTLISINKINEAWPHIESWVDIARGADKTYSVGDIKNFCISGEFDLWIVKDNGEYKGFLIGWICRAPRGKTYYGAWLGGVDLADWVADGLNAVEVYAKNNGCVAYSFIGRKAWKRLLGYDYEGVYYYKSLI